MPATHRIVVGAVLCAAAVQASATSYIDEAAWRAAVLNAYALETFDSLVAGSDVTSLPLLGIRFDPLNDGTQPTVQQYSSTGGVVKSGPNNFLNDRDFSLPARGPFSMRPVDGATFVYGIGLWNVGGDDTLRLSFYDISNTLIESVISPSSSGFFGIVNPLGAAGAVVDFVGGNGYAPVDDLQTAVRGTFVPEPPNAIPEPETYALMLLGMAAIGYRARRRRG